MGLVLPFYIRERGPEDILIADQKTWGRREGEMLGKEIRVFRACGNVKK